MYEVLPISCRRSKWQEWWNFTKSSKMWRFQLGTKIGIEWHYENTWEQVHLCILLLCGSLLWNVTLTTSWLASKRNDAVVNQLFTNTQLNNWTSSQMYEYTFTQLHKYKWYKYISLVGQKNDAVVNQITTRKN